MSTVTHELVRAFCEAGPAIVGRKKWRRIVVAAHKELIATTPENGVGPVIAARRDAVMILRFAMQRCALKR